MAEDAQPNERLLNRKGAHVPTLCTTAVGRGRGAWQGGHGSATRYYHRPRNGSETGTYPVVTSQKSDPQYTNSSKRRRHSLEGPCTKRRRTVYGPSTESYLRHETTVTSPFPYPNLSNIPRESVKRKPAPDTQRLRRQWQTTQAEELMAKIDVPLRFADHAQDCARFVIDNNPGSVSEERGGRPNQEERTFTLPPVQFVAPLDSGPIANNVNDEIIIPENIDDLRDVQSCLVPSSPIRSEHDLNSPHPSTSPLEISEPSRVRSSEYRGPLRVFRSGVLSLPPMEGDAGSMAPQATPICAESSSSHRPPGDMMPGSSLTDNTFPVFQELGALTKGFTTGLPNTVATSIVNQTPSMSSGSARVSLINEVETLNPNGNKLSSQHQLVTEDASIQLPVSRSDKIRLILHSDATSVLTVSMRGSVDLSNVLPLRHRRTLKASKPGDSVDDACLLRAGDERIAIFGHARDQGQLTWCRFRLDHDTSRNEYLPLLRPWNSVKKGGVSASVSMMQHLQFATGGYDHIVHLWEVKPDFSSVSPRPLAIKHTSQVQALLAIRDTSHKLVSAGADCNVHFWDLSSERVVNTLRPSNTPYHLHPTTSPFCTLFEVAHRDLQFEVRDHRLVSECPVLRFGYNTDKVHGRFIKGATSSNVFACGSRDGNVRLWDLRNVKYPPMATTSHPGQKLVHVDFKQSHLIVCSESGQTSLVRYDGG